jgi:carbon-monoxide dehydrogenase medium subunit
VIPSPFNYVRAASTDDAVRVLAESSGGAKILAGGHSLLPLMKRRLVSPAVLVDIGRLEQLSYIRDAGDHVAIGALTRHHDVGRSTLVAEAAPLLRYVARQVGDPQVRHRGTIGGALAHGHPASDIAAALLALRATMVVQGRAGWRHIPADNFFTGFQETALQSDELVTEIRLAKQRRADWSFQKVSMRTHDWAIVGVACVLGPQATVALVNMGSTPMRARGVEEALAGGAASVQACVHADDGTTPPSDLNGSGDYRRHLARVLVRRAIDEAGQSSLGA